MQWKKNRQKRNSPGSHSARVQAGVGAAQTRQAEVGDAVWVARARAGAPPAEFVLDYVVERKSVADLLGSIKGGGRYEKQKYFLARCGLRRVMYLIEGAPEAEAAGVRAILTPSLEPAAPGWLGPARAAQRAAGPAARRAPPARAPPARLARGGSEAARRRGARAPRLPAPCLDRRPSPLPPPPPSASPRPNTPHRIPTRHASPPPPQTPCTRAALRVYPSPSPNSPSWAAQVDLKMVRTAGHITEVVDGFQVLRTESAGATFRLYARITQCLQARYGPPYGPIPNPILAWPGSVWARGRLHCATTKDCLCCYNRINIQKTNEQKRSKQVGAHAHGVHGCARAKAARVPSRRHARLARGMQPRWQPPRGRGHCHASPLSAI